MNNEGSAGISDIPSVEATPKAASSPEANKEISAKQRTIDTLNKGLDLIRSKKASGFFDTPDKADAKTSAETALTQEDEQKKLDSDGLKSFFKTTASMGTDAVEIENAAAENMKVRVVGDNVDEMLSLAEWREALNPADGAKPSEERIRQLESGRFGYVFPEEAKVKSPEDGIADKAVDATIKDNLARIKNEIDQRKKNGAEITTSEQRQLLMLGLADIANGPAGPRIKYEALQMLKGLGYGGLDTQIMRLDGQLEAADEALANFLKSKNYTLEAVAGKLKNGGLEALIAEGKLGNMEGFEELIFGDKMEEGKLEEILDPDRKKKRKDLLLSILGILVAGVMPLGQELTKISNS